MSGTKSVTSIMTPVIEVRGLYQDYSGEYSALRGVDLSIRAGEFVAIIGENGAGKSTLVKHFNGLLRPSKGDVLLDGSSIEGMSTAKLARHVGYVFQNPDHQIFHEKVIDEVSYGPRQLGMEPCEVERRVRDAMAAVGISDYANDFPMSLSRGARQRIAVASILAMGCRVVILDEPTTGQDYRESREIMNLARRLQEEGTTIIFITHDMALVAEYATRAIVMCEGRVIADGPPVAIFGLSQVLERAHLLPPQVTRIGMHWDGEVYLTVSELEHCMLRELEGVRAVG